MHLATQDAHLLNFIFIFVQWKLKIIEGDVWVVSLYYIKKRLNNCFNCTMKLNERPSSSSFRVLGCPASPPLRVCWLLVHLRWKKKKTFDMVVGKYRSKKIERCMFYQNCCCCCCCCCCGCCCCCCCCCIIEAAKLFSSSQLFSSFII